MMGKPNPYHDRNCVLERMGFSSYSDYLKSELWANIRNKVFQQHNGLCYVCDRQANEVHHRSYSEVVMRGLNLGRLVPLCSGCHRQIEMLDDGKKRRFGDVDYYLSYLRRNTNLVHNPRVTSACEKCGKIIVKRSNLCRKCAKKSGSQYFTNHAPAMTRPATEGAKDRPVDPLYQTQPNGMPSECQAGEVPAGLGSADTSAERKTRYHGRVARNDRPTPSVNNASLLSVGTGLDASATAR